MCQCVKRCISECVQKWTVPLERTTTDQEKNRERETEAVCGTSALTAIVRNEMGFWGRLHLFGCFMFLEVFFFRHLIIVVITEAYHHLLPTATASEIFPEVYLIWLLFSFRSLTKSVHNGESMYISLNILYTERPHSTELQMYPPYIIKIVGKDLVSRINRTNLNPELKPGI